MESRRQSTVAFYFVQAENEWYWPDCWILCWSLSSRFPWHQWQRLFLSTSFVIARPPPNPFPSSLVSDWLPILIQCVISPLIGLRSLVIQSQMWTRCTSPALLYCSCILTESTCRSNQSDNLTPLHRQAGIPSAERLMQLSFPLAVELSCFFTSSLDCAPVRTILLLSLSLSLCIFWHCVWLSMFHWSPLWPCPARFLSLLWL